MSTRIRFGLLLLAFFIVALDAAHLPAYDEAATPTPLRVLFIGNSQVYYNDLPKILEKLSELASADRPRIKTDRSVSGGATLERHWNEGDGKDTPRGKIAAGKWDFVVIQEFGGYAQPEKTVEYSRLFHELIQQYRAQTVLMCHAHLAANYPQGFDELHSQHLALAKDLKVPLAAGGRAWQMYLGRAPTEEQKLDLYNPDKGHPGPRGSYLYACTLYATITGKSPVGLRTKVFGSHGAPDVDISESEAERFAEAAWKACQELNEPR